MDINNDIGVAVKHRLDRFKNSPDHSVWDAIEAKLKKKKKSRIFILWFSGLGLTAMAFLVWFMLPLHHTNQTYAPLKERIKSDYNSETSRLTPISNTDSKASITSKESKITRDDEYIDFDNDLKTTISNDSVSKTQERHYSVVSARTTSQYPVSNSDKKHTPFSNPISEANKINSMNQSKTKTLATVIQANKKNDSIAVNNVLKSKQDSISKLIKQTNLDLDKNKDSIEQNTASRWSITPHALLSYYGALRSKSTDNLSIDYGLLLSYRVTSHTFLRIGVRSLDLQQHIDNNDINLKYLEFPLDFKYAPFEKKLNPYVIGGISYFVLQEARINNQNAANYNTTFSIHAGVGLEHQLIKDFYFNVESKFNYQIKPISERQNINPFVISISTGIEYRF